MNFVCRVNIPYGPTIYFLRGEGGGWVILKNIIPQTNAKKLLQN